MEQLREIHVGQLALEYFRVKYSSRQNKFFLTV